MRSCETSPDSSLLWRSRFVAITQRTGSCIVHNLKVNVNPIQTIKGTMALIHNHSIRGSPAVAHTPLNFRECILKHNYLPSFLRLLFIFSRWNQPKTLHTTCYAQSWNTLGSLACLQKAFLRVQWLCSAAAFHRCNKSGMNAVITISARQCLTRSLPVSLWQTF